MTLVGALRDMQQPRTVTIYRSVGEAGNERWITRARLGEHDAVATAGPVWADVESLPPLTLFPERLQAMKGEATVVATPGSPARPARPTWRPGKAGSAGVA